jgi:ribosomal protein S18 acetylase RimI-like enzyme
MRTRGEEHEICAELRRIRELNKEFTTNFYAAPQQLRDWAGRGVFSLAPGVRTTLLFRRDRHFEHLYHVAASRADLAEALASLDPIPGLPIVTDLVGRPEDVAPIAEIYRANGFEDYVDLVRMVRPGGSSPDVGADTSVDYAQLADIPAIVAFLDRQLDPFRDQIPEADEIESAIARRSILIDRRDGTPGGLLFFEDTGRTSTLRYWYVDSGCFGRGIGGRLMRTYLRQHPSTARFLLWVVGGNASVIAKYERYGFRREKLFDQIMIRRRESSR